MDTPAMESLNDILRRHIFEEHKGYFSDRGLEVECDFDPDMPRIYPGFISDDVTPEHITGMLSELTGEQLDTRVVDDSMTRLRYGTLFVDGVQVLVIEHDGRQIPDAILAGLNRDLTRIHQRRETVNPGGRGGNKRAAMKISPYAGRIYIENSPSSEYKVITTVEIPVQPHG